MAQAPTDIKTEADASRADDTEGLAQAVDQLVSEIDKTVRTFEQDDADTAPKASDAAAPPVEDEPELDGSFEPIVEGPIDEQVDELVEEASEASAEPAPAPEATGEPEPAPEAQAESAEDPSEFESPPSIDALDEAIATSADEDDDFDLEGDFEESSAGVETPAPGVSAAPAPAKAPAPVAASPAEAPPADEQPEESTAEAPQQPAPPRPKVDRGALVVALIEKPARLMSAPLRMAPEAHRDTIGWIALNTLFLAVCVWLYVLLLR